MFIEPNTKGLVRGSLEVICGSMFSGKTEELIRRLKRVRIANQRLLVVKPVIDTRFAQEKIVSHDTNSFVSTPIEDPEQILSLAREVEVVGIDEAQFFNNSITEVCEKLATGGVRVIVAGLDMDFLGNPFGPMPLLMAKADHVTKLHAICVRCGAMANYSFRIAAGEDQVLLGATDSYEPRCRQCYAQP
ncbi:MAG: thymidine kinase [Chitinophagia bacterium]|nr:thymidine kinase [Chitinophagia bacterium]